MRARRIDAELRADRLADPREKCAELRAASETFSYLEDLASDPEAAVVAGALEDAIRALPGVSEAYRHEQLAALGVAREVLQAATRMGRGAGACMAVLAQASVDVSRAGTSAWAWRMPTCSSATWRSRPPCLPVRATCSCSAT